MASSSRDRLAHEGLGLLLRFENVWRNPPLPQRIAKLGAHESACRKTRHAVKIAITDVLHRVEISVFKFTVDLEAVIVHDGIHFVAERFDDRSDHLFIPLDDRLRFHLEFREVEEQDIVFVVVVKAHLERQPQDLLAQPHRLGPEDTGIHDARVAHHRLEIHPVEDIALDVDPRRDFDQLNSRFSEPEHATLGDIEDVLVVLGGVLAREGAVLDLVDELLVLAVALDQQLAVEDRDLEVAGRERAYEDDLLRVLADVDEAAGASKPRAEPRHVEVALLVGLRETEEGRVEAAAVVEVEL